MNELLTEGFMESLVQSYYRSIIVSDDFIQDIDMTYCTINKIDDNVNYVTLTQAGVFKVLAYYDVSEEQSEQVLKIIKRQEKDQVDALSSYLRLESELGSEVVSIILRDGGVEPDDEMYDKTYSLPLNIFFTLLNNRRCKPVNPISLKATNKEINSCSYGDYLFYNKNMDKLLTVFIDVRG